MPGKRKNCLFSAYIPFRREAEGRFLATFTTYLSRLELLAEKSRATRNRARHTCDDAHVTSYFDGEWRGRGWVGSNSYNVWQLFVSVPQV